MLELSTLVHALFEMEHHDGVEVATHTLVMKRTISILSAILLGASVTFAQQLPNHGLVLNGTVIGIRSSEKNGRLDYEVRLLMQFRNDGDKPLILIRHAFLFGKTKIDFLNRSLGSKTRPPDESERIVQSIVIPPWWSSYYEDYDPLAASARSLDTPEPTNRMCVILNPGAYHEFNQTVKLEQGFKLIDRAGQKLKVWDGEIGLPFSEIPVFTIEFSLSLAKHHKDPDFLESLQRRWKRFGVLPLDANGNFTVKSERILNTDGK